MRYWPFNLCTTIVIGGISFLVGCSTPFATNIHSVNEFDGQEPAVIKISPPQVFARETLINDRRKEVEYLSQLLEDSTDKTKVRFQPQLRRDLQTVTAIVGQLQASFDGGAQRQFNRDDDLRAVNNERQMLEAQAALTRARQNLRIEQERLEALEAGTLTTEQLLAGANQPSQDNDAGNGGDANKPSTLPPLGAPADPANQPAVNNLTLGEVSGLLTRLQAAQGLLDRISNAAPVREAATSATPSEDFNDRQAYRAELRASLDQVNLDDIHDKDGNALYRLHSRATVLPGRHKDKFAAARMILIPPELTDEEVSNIYYSWLNYLANDADVARRTDLNLIGTVAGLFELTTLDLGDHVVITAPLTPESVDFARKTAEEFKKDESSKSSVRLLSNSETLESYGNSSAPRDDFFPGEQILSARPQRVGPSPQVFFGISSGQYSVDPLTGCPIQVTVGGARTSQDKTSEVLQSLRDLERDYSDVSRAIKPITVAIRTAIHDADRTSEQKARIGRYMARVIDELLATQQNYRLLAEGIMDKYVLCDSIREKPFDPQKKTDIDVPQQVLDFKNLISLDGPFLKRTNYFEQAKSDALTRPVGRMKAISAGPEELAQTVSTLASAANAVEMAAAIRASLPAQGVSGAAGVGFMRQAIGRIEALERAPIVVGFSGVIDAACMLDKPEPFKNGEWIYTYEPDVRGIYVEAVESEKVATDAALSEWENARPMSVDYIDFLNGISEGNATAEQISQAKKAAQRAESRAFQAWKKREPKPYEDGKWRYTEDPSGIIKEVMEKAIETERSAGVSALEYWRAECEQSINREFRPELGWIFGPRLVPAGNGKKLELVHNVKNFPVSADITVPGWWPRVEVSIETAWVKNWYEGEMENAFQKDIFDTAESKITRRREVIELPYNRVDMDALTDLIFSRLGFGEQIAHPLISLVNLRDNSADPNAPISLRLCKSASEARIQVGGDNLWQSTAAFLNGQPHKSIEILPDMRGISMTFETRNLQISANGEADLVIWTRDGKTRHSVEIAIIDDKDAVNFCAPAQSSVTLGEVDSVSVDRSWLRAGTVETSAIKFRLAPATTLSSGFYSVAIKARKAPEEGVVGGGYSDVHQEKIDVTPATSTIKLMLDPAKVKAAGITDGDRIDFAVIIKKFEDGDEIRRTPPVKPVYYTVGGDALTFKSGDIAGVGANGEVKVTISIPNNFEIRYPGLKKPPADDPGVFLADVHVPAKGSDYAKSSLTRATGWALGSQNTVTKRWEYTSVWKLPTAGGDADNWAKIKAKLSSGVEMKATLSGPAESGVATITETLILKQ